MSETNKAWKHCFSCNQDKESSRFYRNKSKKDDLASQCIECQQNYRFARSTNDPDRASRVSQKRCSRCYKTLPVSSFFKSSDTRDGWDSCCKDCKEISNARYRKSEAGKRNIRNLRLLWNFGITQKDYERLLAQQDGGCAICGMRPKNKHLHVDHDHHAGTIRGLLCAPCNQAIGLLKDSPEILEAAKQYLLNSIRAAA